MFSIIRPSHSDRKSQSETSLKQLLTAIQNDNYPDFIKIITENKKLSCSAIQDGEFPIHRAINLNRTKMVEYLLSKQKSSQALKTKSDDTIWHLAVNNNFKDILDLLFEMCPENNSLNQDNQSVLDLAVKASDHVLLQRLLEKGFNRVNLFAATINTSIFTQLIQNGNSMNIYELDKDGRSLLHFACSNNNADLVRALLVEGLDVNLIDRYGETPLHSAISTGNLNLVAFLITNRAVLKQPSKLWAPSTYFAPLTHEAIELSDLAIISYLIKQGVDLNSQDLFGFNAINFASSLNPKISDLILMELIEGGSDPSKPNRMGISALQNLKENQKMSSFIFNTGKYMEFFEIPSSICFAEDSVSSECCLVCKCEFELNDSIYKIECDHKYHVECLNEWFKTALTCPLCNEMIVKIKPRNCHNKNSIKNIFRLWK